jgi:hypothetical protein
VPLSVPLREMAIFTAVTLVAAVGLLMLSVWLLVFA